MDEVINNTCTEGKMNLSNIDHIKDYLKNNMGGDDDSFYKKNEEKSVAKAKKELTLAANLI